MQPNSAPHVAPRRHPPREDQFDGSLRPPRGAPPLDNGPRPIVPKLRDIRTLNLVYHIWPVASNDVWRWNITRLLPRIEIFNGKRIVAIATDDETVSADEVIPELAGHGITFITMANDARLREGTTFLPLLDAVYTLDPTEATFYGHAKGVSRARSVHTVEKAWAECMYHHCLDFPDRVREALAHKAMYGVSFPIEKAWIYPGTFWWFHNASLFARADWRTLENHVTREGVGWSVEAFPNRFFAEDCERVFPPELIYPPDRKFGLYDERIWTSDVRVPSLNERAKWRWGHAIEREWLTWGKILSGDSIVEAVTGHATLEGARILEIGPGYGRFMESLQKQRVRFGSFTGIDLSPQRSRELRRSFPEGRFIWGDIEKLPRHRGAGAVRFDRGSAGFQAAVPDLSACGHELPLAACAGRKADLRRTGDGRGLAGHRRGPKWLFRKRLGLRRVLEVLPPRRNQRVARSVGLHRRGV
ncbi:MAG TPA: class I SAM-dependent methyltransferase [Pirellulales bacterium]|nr:class I SAM-dependent methyltransferase [Pirellulales bacterium]